ncbi:bromodomain-containing protein DDB_G0280777-like [Mercenaria mercenaria]|uniref:bromodomain-containing protein DDB_G0280777-like n=1 Tax=Mercenaria mercenaria TaxID=6596 RepID=UPI00234F3DC6|nr:bromodomain-containing protein DDB_G0280777-like [Mercenaria mercenaria]XP_045168849.2 bromodomain-containing protein DDB_G0280777-like [Mercenaria mercenaria]XP_045168850.2 bromodomain-containing protein DDB_G0280777-like [Mercenaria mercenaria]XP_053373405.1 bromodomain-containing protein DDB_G0280777-like [Mercenaria mercenaria]
MGMGLRRRGGRRRAGRRNRRVGIGRRRRRFGRRRRGRGGLGTLLFLCCMGGARRNVSYGQDIQELQQQQMLMLQAFGMQQQNLQMQYPPMGQPQFPQQPQFQQQQPQFQQQQPQFQQQQMQQTTYPGVAMTFSSEEEKTEHLKELQAEQMELLNEIMRKQAEEKDPEKLQELFKDQNDLIQQMNQLQTAGYAYPEAIPSAPPAPASVQPQSVPMES